MITSAEFNNFKILQKVSVSLERLTVLVGPNSSGKTTLLNGLHCLSRLPAQPPSEIFTGALAPSTLLATGNGMKPVRLNCQAQYLDRQCRVEITLRRNVDPSEPQAVGWDLSIDAKPNFRRAEVVEIRLVEDADGRVTTVGIWPDIRQRLIEPLSPLQGSLKLRLEPQRLAEADYNDKPIVSLGENGSGLASVLAEMALAQPQQFSEYQEAVRSVIPAVQRIRLARSPVYRTETDLVTINGQGISHGVQRRFTGYKPLLDMAGSNDIPSDAVSEGTLTVMGIFAALMGPSRPRLLLLDDMDRGLHPNAMGRLLQQIRQIMRKDPQLQVVATTHSPYLLDHLEPAEVRITVPNDRGFALVGSLVDHPEFEKWKDLMSPGEFWSTVGESWLKDREKQPNG